MARGVGKPLPPWGQVRRVRDKPRRGPAETGGALHGPPTTLHLRPLHWALFPLLGPFWGPDEPHASLLGYPGCICRALGLVAPRPQCIMESAGGGAASKVTNQLSDLGPVQPHGHIYVHTQHVYILHT